MAMERMPKISEGFTPVTGKPVPDKPGKPVFGIKPIYGKPESPITTKPIYGKPESPITTKPVYGKPSSSLDQSKRANMDADKAKAARVAAMKKLAVR